MQRIEFNGHPLRTVRQVDEVVESSGAWAYQVAYGVFRRRVRIGRETMYGGTR